MSTQQAQPDAHVVDGTVVDLTGVPFLTPSQVAARYRVAGTEPSRWRALYTADSATPYPAWIPDQRVRLDGDRSVRVHRDAMDAWVLAVFGDRARAGSGTGAGAGRGRARRAGSVKASGRGGGTIPTLPDDAAVSA